MEGAVAVAQKHTYGITIGHHEVGFAIASHIPNRHRRWIGAGGERLLGLKGPVAVAQQHANRVTASIGHDDVEFAVIG